MTNTEPSVQEPPVQDPAQHALIVDDHPVIRLAVATRLEGLGFHHIHEAQSALDATQLMRTYRPRLVVVDLDLPGLPGADLVERLVPRYPETRVVVLSAMEVASSLPRVLRAGAHGFVEKQCGLDELTDALRAVMGGFMVYPVVVMRSLKRMSEGGKEENGLMRLSIRELTVLQYLAEGLSNVEIGRALSISSKTVSTHKSNIFFKLKLETVVELVDFAREHRLIV